MDDTINEYLQTIADKAQQASQLNRTIWLTKNCNPPQIIRFDIIGMKEEDFLQFLLIFECPTTGCVVMLSTVVTNEGRDFEFRATREIGRTHTQLDRLNRDFTNQSHSRVVCHLTDAATHHLKGELDQFELAQ